MATATTVSLLDNPIWHSLNSHHIEFAKGGSLAKRFDSEIGPLSGMANQSIEAYTELMELFAPGEPAVLFLDGEPRIPAAWNTIKLARLVQMVCVQPELARAAMRKNLPVIPLGSDDIPQMLTLTALTEPGPFRQRTNELGHFIGLREAGTLSAMAGERLALPGYREVSAVCTHPEFRGRGYAKFLVAAVAVATLERGETPFLTSYEANTGAIRVYESVGFSVRRTLELAVISPRPVFG